MKVIIDRFEGEYAIVELPDLSFIEVPRILFEGAKENDVINITIENQETDLREERVSNLMKSLFKD